MTKDIANRIPVVLVHGWKSHPGIWNRLDPLLSAASVPCWKFDHVNMKESAVPDIASALAGFMQEMRDREEYDGPVDMVCHSMGSCIARYFLEVDDGRRKQERVRQLICLGPPNTGSALAELFNDPSRRDGILATLAGVFVPRDYDPGNDPLVQDVRPGSHVMEKLKAAGIRPDIRYRIIVTANTSGDPAFFPWFSGRTWECTGAGIYRETFSGDGIVANAESCLPGVCPDVITGNPSAPESAVPQVQYCHINLPRNPAVMNRILQYLVAPDRKKEP